MKKQTSKPAAANASGKPSQNKAAKAPKGAKAAAGDQPQGDAAASAGGVASAPGGAGGDNTAEAVSGAATGTTTPATTPAPKAGDINPATGKPWTVKELKAEMAKNAAIIQAGGKTPQGVVVVEPPKPIVLSTKSVAEITTEWIQETPGGHGFTVKPGMPVEEWAALVRSLDRQHESIGFAIGDLLNYGVNAYGKTYEAALAATGRAIKTLRNWKMVASSIAPELRQPDKLSFSIHEAVSSLPAAKQKAILDEAVKKDLSVKEVRALAKKEKPAPRKRTTTPAPSPAPGANADKLTAAEEKAWEKMQTAIDTVAQYMKGDVWVKKLKKLDRNSVKGSLKIISEAYEAVVNEGK